MGGSEEEEQNAQMSLHVRLVTKDAHRETTVTLPQKAKVGDLKNTACDAFGVEREGNKLVDYYQQRFHASLEGKYDISLEGASLLDGQHIKLTPRDLKTDDEDDLVQAPSSPTSSGPGALAVISPDGVTHPTNRATQRSSASAFGSSFCRGLVGPQNVPFPGSAMGPQNEPFSESARCSRGSAPAETLLLGVRHRF
ncbi:hypothetical protein DUNSADRAFT_17501 [Dunaliella salina]|uniref:Ubiquitin-like domain-containing protein n=1 Tax=Dunaliella salina TaxID=3046 RepID=A0ABQ7G1N0_DUNSA|nr:hypothetical protein DUNSADRAFT_17501 [Dunaliella salina]|eukprot:KAF5828504.1 hypothetical protein DUNSADRAFT_17501 [Dunaliella salina]